LHHVKSFRTVSTRGYGFCKWLAANILTAKTLFHIEQVSVFTELKAEEVQPKLKEQRIDTDRPLSQQARTSATAFWDHYRPIRPKRLLTYLQ